MRGRIFFCLVPLVIWACPSNENGEVVNRPAIASEKSIKISGISIPGGLKDLREGGFHCPGDRYQGYVCVKESGVGFLKVRVNKVIIAVGFDNSISNDQRKDENARFSQIVFDVPPTGIDLSRGDDDGTDPLFHSTNVESSTSRIELKLFSEGFRYIVDRHGDDLVRKYYHPEINVEIEISHIPHEDYFMNGDRREHPPQIVITYLDSDDLSEALENLTPESDEQRLLHNMMIQDFLKRYAEKSDN